MKCERSVIWVPRTKRLFLILVLLTSFIETSLSEWNNVKSEAPVKKLKILAAFAHPGKSHFKFFEPLLIELVNRGHQITVISYFPRSKESNVTLPNYRDIDLGDNDDDVFVDVIDLGDINDEMPLRFAFELELLRIWSVEHCNKALGNKKTQKLLASEEKFDLVLTEIFNSDCFLCLVDRFKAPFLALSSHDVMPWALQRFGNPYELSYIPNNFQSWSTKMSFFQRVANVFSFYYAISYYGTAYQWSMQKVVDEKCGKNQTRRLKDISGQVSAVLLNTHYSIFGVRPMIPNIVEVGGLHIPREVKPLPGDVKKFLDDAEEGVMYFNLGSMVKASSMPKEHLKDILKVIGGLRLKVLWKWEEEKLPGKPGNVMLRKWLPQFDILNHPNVKCFLGHGGLLGLSESVLAGVPMVLIPFYGDQFHNGAALVARGTAKVVYYSELNEENLGRALHEVCHDSRYGERAKELSKAYSDRPESPLETAVWWSEYIGRSNKNYNYLQSSASNLTWYQYYLLDVLLSVLVALSIFVYLSYRCLKFAANCFNPPKKSSKLGNGFNHNTEKKKK